MHCSTVVMRNALPKNRNPARTRPHKYLLLILSAKIAKCYQLSLTPCVLTVDFSFTITGLGDGFRGFRLLGSEFRITALNFDIQADEFRIFIAFRVFREFRVFGKPISQTYLRLAIEIASCP